MNREPRTSTTLAGALRAAADALGRESPPPWRWPDVDAAAARAPRRARPHPFLRWAGAGLCAGVLAASVLLMLPPPHAPLAGDFVPLAGADRWPADAEAAWVVRTELPAARLASLGLPYDPARAAAPVRAELLVHPSGDVLAVRLLR